MVNGEQKNEITSSSIVSLIIHQDSLLWSRLQTMGVIQIGTISAAFGAKLNVPFSICILVFGLILTLCIFFLLQRDRLDRKKLEELLGKQTEELIYSTNRRWYVPFQGDEMAWTILILLFIADIALGVAIIRGWL